MNYFVNETMIGNNIKTARKAKGYTQQDLYEMTSISTTVLSGYENNKTKPSLDTLANIAHALEVTIDYLYYGNEEKKVISSATNEGELITNCIYNLWEQEIIDYIYLFNENGQFQNQFVVKKYMIEISQLVNSLNQFKNTINSFNNPKLFIKQLLESTTNQINNKK